STEDLYEDYKDIVGDPIYDVYEDDVIVTDLVFRRVAFENLTRAKFGRKQICAKLGFPAEILEDQICASFVQVQTYAVFVEEVICANFGSNPVRANFVSNQVRANFVSNSVRAKIGQNRKIEMKMDLQRSLMLKTLLKIRGRIFLGRRELMQRRYKIRGRIFSWPTRPD
ncbi:unnamed protein product, partial [Arabidopsis halleri]